LPPDLPFIDEFKPIAAGSCGTLQAQKSPQGLRCAGFQDFISGSGDRQQRILGWRSLNWLCNLLFKNE
jgi:hypothetical protein